MSYKTLFYFLIINLVFFISSCKKNQIGGKATLKGVVLHHSKPIPNAYIYIKYNSSEFPGTDVNLYDTYVQADDNGNYKISFYKGTYYVYAKGFDYAIAYPNIVKGGLTVTLRNNEVSVKDIAITEE